MSFVIRMTNNKKGFYICDVFKYGVLFTEKDLYDDDAIKMARDWYKKHGDSYLAGKNVEDYCGNLGDEYGTYETLKQVFSPNQLLLAYQSEYITEEMRVILGHVLNNHNPYSKPIVIKRASRSHNRGHVYLLKADNGYHKIGKAKVLDRRVTTLQVNLPVHLELICSCEVDDYDGFEKYLHEMYAYKRDHGEWFAITDDEVADIVEIMESANANIQ